MHVPTTKRNNIFPFPVSDFPLKNKLNNLIYKDVKVVCGSVSFRERTYTYDYE